MKPTKPEVNLAPRHELSGFWGTVFDADDTTDDELAYDPDDQADKDAAAALIYKMFVRIGLVCCLIHGCVIGLMFWMYFGPNANFFNRLFGSANIDQTGSLLFLLTPFWAFWIPMLRTLGVRGASVCAMVLAR
jgi:hypothetical protein